MSVGRARRFSCSMFCRNDDVVVVGQTGRGSAMRMAPVLEPPCRVVKSDAARREVETSIKRSTLAARLIEREW